MITVKRNNVFIFRNVVKTSFLEIVGTNVLSSIITDVISKIFSNAGEIVIVNMSLLFKYQIDILREKLKFWLLDLYCDFQCIMQ